MIEWIVPAAFFSVAAVITSLRVLREYERGVVFRLGRLVGAKGPGLIFLLPLGIERMVKVPLRIVTLDIPPQDIAFSRFPELPDGMEAESVEVVIRLRKKPVKGG